MIKSSKFIILVFKLIIFVYLSFCQNTFTKRENWDN